MEELINKIKNEINQRISNLENNKDLIKKDLDVQNKLVDAVAIFIKNYEIDGTINLDILDEFSSYLKDLNIFDENKDYKELLEIKKDLEMTFPDKVSLINNIFDNLIKDLKRITNNHTRVYTSLTREKSRIEYSIEEEKKFLNIINKIENNKLIYQKDFEVLDNYINISDIERQQLYVLITTHNADIMNELISNEKKRQSKEKLKEVLKVKKQQKEDNSNVVTQENSNQETIESEQMNEGPEQLENFAEVNQVENPTASNEENEHAEESNEHLVENIGLTNEVKELLKKASKIIDENNISDAEFLKTLVGLSYDEMLHYITVHSDPASKIAAVLKHKIIPDIEKGNLKDTDIILTEYIEEYNKINENKKIPVRLESINKAYILDTMNQAIEMLEFYNNNKNDTNVMSMEAYFQNLGQTLADIQFCITDDEMFNSTEVDELYEMLKEEIKNIKDIYEKINNKNTKKVTMENETLVENDDLSVVNNFYDNIENLIIFPDGIDFSQQIDEDETLSSIHKKKVLNCLKRLSVDDSILTSSDHKLKDPNSKYQKLRRYRGTDYRIIYRVSQAKGLKTYYNKNVNAIFVIKVFYGATDNKEKLYNSAKSKYDEVEEQVEEIINILNSNNMEAINKIIQTNYSKLKDYIDACYELDEHSISKGAKGGSVNE